MQGMKSIAHVFIFSFINPVTVPLAHLITYHLTNTCQVLGYSIRINYKQSSIAVLFGISINYIQWVPGALCLGVKRSGREAGHSPLSSAEVENAWKYTSTPPIRLHCVVLG